jgi:hypothetical protein
VFVMENVATGHSLNPTSHCFARYVRLLQVTG